MAFLCDLCGEKIEQGYGTYNRTDKTTGDTIHLCARCFEKDTGVNPDIYFTRKYGCYIFIVGVLLTIFIFIKFGYIAGGISALVTYFFYRFLSSK